MGDICEFLVGNIEETKSLANKIASLTEATDLITLTGDLGAGKTTFSGFLINSLIGENINVTSPTFNLVHNYDYKNGVIWHFDLYRLKHAHEIYELGFDEALDNLAIIEWPEIIKYLLPKDRLEIIIKCDIDNNRKYIVQSFGKWIGKINEINQ